MNPYTNLILLPKSAQETEMVDKTEEIAECSYDTVSQRMRVRLEVGGYQYHKAGTKQYVPDIHAAQARRQEHYGQDTLHTTGKLHAKVHGRQRPRQGPCVQGTVSGVGYCTI